VIPVDVAREVVNDLRPLPRPLQLAALKMMGELRHDAYKGQRLLWTQDAVRSACRKLYFDVADDELWRGYRIIYDLLPDDANPTLVRILAVGAKSVADDEDVYERASRRRD
jgi:hypothetical protein